MPEEEIVVLASSLKWGGRCVAGISTRTGQWVRPVSSLVQKQLTPFHYRIDGRNIQPLDIVRFDHQGELDDPAQPENIAVGPSPWRLTGRLEPADAYTRLSPYLIEGPSLLGNRGAAVPAEEAARGVETSLALVAPRRTEFHLESPWEESSKPRPRVSFMLAGREYDLALTDFVVRPALVKAGLGAHDLPELGFDAEHDVLLTVSLAEARDEWCTKLVAAVIFVSSGG